MLSFLSPCCLPLVPGYLSGVGSGVSSSREIAPRVAAFLLGFGSIFVMLGLTASSLGGFLNFHQPALRLIAGATVIAIGVLLLIPRT